MRCLGQQQTAVTAANANPEATELYTAARILGGPGRVAKSLGILQLSCTSALPRLEQPLALAVQPLDSGFVGSYMLVPSILDRCTTAGVFLSTELMHA